MENVRNTFQSNEKSNYELYSIYLQNPYNFDKHWKICHENKKNIHKSFLFRQNLVFLYYLQSRKKLMGHSKE